MVFNLVQVNLDHLVSFCYDVTFPGSYNPFYPAVALRKL